LKHLILFAAVGLAVLFTRPAVATEMFGPGSRPCGDKSTTRDMVECLAAKTKAADQHLNAAYKDLLQRIDPEQAEPLKAAERAWIQYRDANCQFYSAHEGTISQLLGAECMRALTVDRAAELAKADKED